MPVGRRNGETGDDRTQGRSRGRKRRPSRQEVGQLEEAVDVADRGAAGRETGAAEVALEKPEDDERGEIVDHGGRDGDDDEDAQRHHVRRVAADDGDLGHGSEDQRADAVAQHVHGQTQRRDVGRDAHLLHDHGLRGREDRRPHVHGQRVQVDLQHHEALLAPRPILRVLRVVRRVPVDQRDSVRGDLGLDRSAGLVLQRLLPRGVGVGLLQVRPRVDQAHRRAGHDLRDRPVRQRVGFRVRGRRRRGELVARHVFALGIGFVRGFLLL